MEKKRELGILKAKINDVVYSSKWYVDHNNLQFSLNR